MFYMHIAQSVTEASVVNKEWTCNCSGGYLDRRCVMKQVAPLVHNIELLHRRLIIRHFGQRLE